MNNYHFYEEIGRTRQSVVYKGRLKKSLYYIAVKSADKTKKAKIANELRIAQSLDHENVLKYYNHYETKNHIWSICEYCPGGDLLHVLEQDKRLPEETVLKMAVTLRDGLLYLHTQGVVYADMKSSSILCNEFGVLKYGDFGLARLVTDENPDVEGKRGTPYYMAPELFNEEGVYSYYSDLWGLGCILYEMASSHPPFISNNFQDLIKFILTEDVAPVAQFSGAFNDLLVQLLQKDPAERISWGELLLHPFWADQQYTQVELPVHSVYQKYLNDRGVLQRTAAVDYKRDSGGDIFRLSSGKQKNMFRESLKESYQAFCSRDNFVITSKDQILDFARKTLEEAPFERDTTFHQRANSEAHTIKQIRQNFHPPPVSELIVHSTEVFVDPIVSDESIPKRLESNEIELWPIEKVASSGESAELELHLSEIYSILAESPHDPSNIGLLTYLQFITINANIANKLINSAFVQLFLNILMAEDSELKSRVLSVFAQLLRHATFIEKELVESGLPNSLAQLLEGDNGLIAEKAMAALGEYLFFASTQMDEEEYKPEWDIPQDLFDLVLTQIAVGTQYYVLLYACKTIENITAQTHRAGDQLTETNTVGRLAGVFMCMNSVEIKQSASAALAHIVRRDPLLLNPELSQLFVAKRFLRCLAEEDSRVQQNFLTMLTVLYKNNRRIYDNQEVIKDVLGLMDHQGIIIRAKCMLILSFIIQEDFMILIYFANTKMFNLIDKLAKDPYTYVQNCLHHLLESIAEATLQLTKIALEGNTEALPVISRVCNSPSARYKISYPGFVVNSAKLLRKFSDNDTVITIIESLSTRNVALKECVEVVVMNLLPALLSTFEGHLEIRYRNLKSFTDILLIYLYDEDVFSYKGTSPSSRIICRLLKTELTPYLPALLRDDDSVKIGTLKLLSAIVEKFPGFVAVVTGSDLLLPLMELFNPETNALNSHLINIIKIVIESKSLSLDLLLKYRLAGKMNIVVNHAISNNWCVEEALDLLYELLFSIASTAPSQDSKVLMYNLVYCSDLLKYEDHAIAERASHCLLLVMQLFAEDIAKNYSEQFEDSMLVILCMDKPTLKKKALKVVKALIKHKRDIENYIPLLELMRDHPNEYIQEQALAILTSVNNGY